MLIYRDYDPLIDNRESVTFKKMSTPNIDSRVYGKQLQGFSASHAAYFVIAMNQLIHNIRILITLLVYTIHTKSWCVNKLTVG